MTTKQPSSGHTQPSESFIRCNIGGFIHNHFIIKALYLTRPGGVVAVLTSRYTLDAGNPAARREMAALADLVGAVRLPGGAMAAAAGTNAICDLLLLRRRPHDSPPPDSPPAEVECLACRAGRCQTFHPGEAWDRTVSIDTDGGPVKMNELFARHPNLVLGEISSSRAQYRDRDLVVTAHPEPLGPQLAATLEAITAAATATGLGWTAPLSPPVPKSAVPAARPQAAAEGQLKEGSIVATGTGAFARIASGRPEPFTPTPKSGRAELRALIDIRDSLTATLAAQAASGHDTDYGFAQHRLNRAYDTYLERFGPLNRYKLARTGHTDPETGDELYRRNYPPMGGFRSDPDFYTVLALEVFDPETHTARKAAVFTRRVVGPRPPVLGADSPASALAVCLDQTGRADLAFIASLLGMEVDEARAGLGDLVYENPTSGELVPAPRYLSGDVRSKLDAALDAAERDDRFAVNVDALRQVLPPDLGPDEISARPGVGWIDAADLTDFARQVLGADKAMVEHSPVTAMWAVTAPTWQRNTVAMTSEWGTKRADAIRLLSDSLEQRPVKVYDALDDGRRVLNSDATLAAREKQEALEARFAEWVWEDPDRKARLVERYNRLFNSLVVTRYDGSHLSLPGLAESFTPHQHQRDAVWRIISEPTCLLGHAVGAGKTATMVMAGMEMRRLGLVKRPAYAVPNHMLEQFTGELLQLYPQARVLVADRNAVTPAARKRFVGRCATGEWDAIVMTHSSFERIPVSPAAERAYIEAETEQLRQAIDASNAAAGLTVKRLEKLLARAEERQKRLLDVERDDGISFEECGIDYLFVDEAHAFKRLAFATHIEGISGAGSQRASDMHMKLELLRDRHGPRVATFATGTFVTVEFRCSQWPRLVGGARRVPALRSCGERVEQAVEDFRWEQLRG